MRLLEVRSGNKEEIEKHLAILPSTFYIDGPVTDAVLDRLLYHGSPTNPQKMGRQIMPQQAKTGTGKPGEEINHGEPAVSVSAHPYLPVARSIIHQCAESLAGAGKDMYPLMGVLPNKSLDRFIFTNADVYSALRQAEAVGYLYGIEQAPPGTYVFEPKRYRGRHNEIRIPVPTSWDWVAEVGLDDLPQDILVAPAGKARRAYYFNEFRGKFPGHPLELAKHLGIEVMRLGDYVQTL